MKRILGFLSMLVLIVVVFAVGAFAAQFGLLNSIFGSQTPRTDVTVVLNQIQLVSELTTTRYDTSGTVIIDRDMPAVVRALYGDRLTLFGTGTVTAGIDLATVTRDKVTVAEDGSVTINLPYPRLLDCIVKENETRVLAREVSLFTWEDNTFETRARRTLLLNFRNVALENGIFEQTRAQTDAVVKAFVGAILPNTPVTITFEDPPEQMDIPFSCQDADAPVPTPTPAP